MTSWNRLQFFSFFQISRLATFLELPEHEHRDDGPVPPGSIRIKDADVFANQISKGGSFLLLPINIE